VSPRTIIGFDPEHGGDDALALGTCLARLVGGGVEVVAVLSWPSHLADHADIQREVDAELADRFAAVREQLDGLDVETRGIAHHSPAQVLTALAEDAEATLIVIASAHRGPIGRTLLGGVGESLAHGAPCAVAIAPRGYGQDEDAGIARLAVAYDGSDEAETALTTAAAIAERAHAELTVLTVADYPRYTRAAAWSLLNEGEIHDREHDDKSRLVEAAVAATPAAVPAEGRVLTGDTARQLSEASADFDLIVTGSRSYGPVRRTLLGSATRKLLADSGCPVLVMPRGADPLLAPS
jgi:nucleotide-binding universal stress UspA family protein